MISEETVHEFLELPMELREFVAMPVNRPYLELAMKLSNMSRTSCAPWQKICWILLFNTVTDQTTPITLADEGKKEYEKGNFQAAADLFSQAAQAYASSADELNAAEMKNNESVALLQAGKAREALQAAEGTEEVFLKAGDLKRQGIAISNRAAALEGLKKWKEALAEYDRAASLFEQIGEGDMHSMVRKAAANINLKHRRITDSQMDVIDSLRLVEKPTLTQRFMKFLMRIGLDKIPQGMQLPR